MKLLMLTDSANVHSYKWATYIKSKGVDIEVLSLSDIPIEDIPLHTFHSRAYKNRKNNNEYNRFAVIREILPQIKRFVKIIKPDIIHSHFASSYGLIGALSGFHPCIVSVWGSDITDFPKKNLINRQIIKYVFSKADLICASSQYLLKEIEKYSDKKPHLIYFGTDFDLFKPVEEISKDKHKPYIFGTIKALYPHYGIKHLIEAAAMVNNEITEWVLWIGGEGTERKQLEELAERLGIKDKVKFLGKLPHRDVLQVMNQMDVFVVPSIREAFGVAAVEASGCGLPVIVSNTGGLPEIVEDGVTGFWVEPGNANAIAEKLLLLYKDDVLREKMGKQGRDAVKAKFSWRENADKMIEIYEKTLKERH